MSAPELDAAFLDPFRIEAWLRTGASPLGLAGQVGALMASCALESKHTLGPVSSENSLLLPDGSKLTRAERSVHASACERKKQSTSSE